jgi:hypothetical protein
MTRTSEQQSTGLGADLTSNAALATRVRTVAAAHIVEMLAEVPAILRRLRILLAVLSFSIPLFLAALVVVLWHLAS